MAEFRLHLGVGLRCAIGYTKKARRQHCESMVGLLGRAGGGTVLAPADEEELVRRLDLLRWAFDRRIPAGITH